MMNSWDKLEKKRNQWIHRKIKHFIYLCVILCVCGFIPGLLQSSTLIELFTPVVILNFICSLFLPLYWCSLKIDSLNIYLGDDMKVKCY